MARVRKSADSNLHSASQAAVWFIAAYIRLSREDGNDESLSVTNQKKIIGEYLETCFEGEFTLVDYYIDDTAIIGLNQKTLCFRVYRLSPIFYILTYLPNFHASPCLAPP